MSLPQQVLLCKNRIDLLVELEPDFKLAPHSRVLIHDRFSLPGLMALQVLHGVFDYKQVKVVHVLSRFPLGPTSTPL